MEPDHKAMIVISHPWEFVPKGNSHLNYHTNSSSNNNLNNNNNNNGNNTNNINSAIKSDNKTSLASTGAANLDQSSLQQADKKPGVKKNVRVMINSEFTNTTLSDMSYGYWQKSPLVNKLNFDHQVIHLNIQLIFFY